MKDGRLHIRLLKGLQVGLYFFSIKRFYDSSVKMAINGGEKKDSRAIAEAYERLKVGNAEALSCYYARGEHDPTFQRRIYWMLDPEYGHIVLVHYRDVSDREEVTSPISHICSGSGTKIGIDGGKFEAADVGCRDPFEDSKAFFEFFSGASPLTKSKPSLEASAATPSKGSSEATRKILLTAKL